MPTKAATMARTAKTSDRGDRTELLGMSSPQEVESNVIGGLCLELVLDRNSGGSLVR
jgi:hypothetical protein